MDFTSTLASAVEERPFEGRVESVNWMRPLGPVVIFTPANNQVANSESLS